MKTQVEKAQNDSKCLHLCIGSIEYCKISSILLRKKVILRKKKIKVFFGNKTMKLQCLIYN